MNTTVDDADTPAVYSTNPAWNLNVWAEQNPQPLYGTNHGTPNPNASMTFTFTGTAVYVYGYKASDHGFRDVSVDGADPVRCDGRTGAQGSRSLVYWVSGLTPGTHDITIQHTGTQGQYLNIDYFLVTTNSDGSGGSSGPSPTRTGNGPTPTNSGGNDNTNNNQSSSNTGIIVGVVVAAAVVSLIALIWFIWSRRRKNRVRPEKGAVLDEGGAKPMQTTAGVAPYPHIEPYYSPVHQPAQPYQSIPHPFGAPTQRQPYPESSSGYYSRTDPSQSVYSSAPSTSSPPPTEARFVPMAASATTGTHTIPESHSTPWASSTSATSTGETETARTATEDPSIRKARYVGTTSPSFNSSSSRPFSFPASPTAEETVPPPRYEQ